MGTKKGTGYSKMWGELGILEGIPIIQKDVFLKIELSNGELFEITNDFKQFIIIEKNSIIRRQSVLQQIKAWARNLKLQIFVLYYAYKDKRVPLYAKIFAACVVAYAFSPFDLIPDFIPILGYLDDVIIVPLGVMFALKIILKKSYPIAR